MNATNQPKPKRRWCQVRPWTVLLGLLVLSGCGPSKEQQAVDAYNRGVVYGKKGDRDKEIAEYTEAIRLQPDFADAYYNRGVAYRGTGATDKAIADYTEAVRLKPDFADAYYNRAVDYGSTGDKAKAEADFAKAKELGYKPE